MYRYYNNKRVRILRYFTLNHVNYAVIFLNGEELAVKLTELSEAKSEFVQGVDKIESTVSKLEADGTEYTSTIKFTTDLEEPLTHKVEYKPVPKDIIEAINITDESVEIDTSKIIIEPETTTINVIATEHNGKKVNLGSIDDLEDSEQVKKLKFDVDAIKRCLDGEQKRHRKYSFSTESSMA